MATHGWCRKSPKVVEMLPLRAAQDRWRPTNGPHLVALVRAGAPLERGVPVKRPPVGAVTLAA